MGFLSLSRQETKAVLVYLQYLAHSTDIMLDPEIAAGKVIFEETAGGVGCQSCHGIDAKGGFGPDIRGANAGSIREQLMGNEDMQFIKLEKKR